MEKFFTDAVNEKAAAKSIGNTAMTQIDKIVANSGYGFWGLRVKDRDFMTIQEKSRSPIYKYLHANKFMNYRKVGNYSLPRVIEDLPITDFNVGVASAISSYARMKLWSLIHDIEKKGGKVYMCDTDSVIINLKLNDHDDLMTTCMWDGCGKDRGALKTQADDCVPKTQLEQLKKQEGGVISFDKFILGGCKFYALLEHPTTLSEQIRIAKCKGFKNSAKLGQQLTYEHFEELCKGGSLQPSQLQFRCPKANHVGDGKDCAMTAPTKTKMFRFTYTKGDIDPVSGAITPFYY
jgi:hypothetical protein